jgi:molecular chaperone DnaJ
MNPHDELGVDFGASLAQIKQAYRRLAAKWHPDRNADPHAVKRMQRINQAYQQLCDWDEAEADDEDMGPDEAPPESPPPKPKPQQAKPPPKPKPKAKAAKAPWWERDWGAATWQADGQADPLTLKHSAKITLESAAFGCLHHVKGSVHDACESCAGVGRLVSSRAPCSMCGGDGHVPGAKPSTWAECAQCHGDGADRKACDTCQGTGQARSARRYHYEVRIPAGVRDGQTVMLRGQGQRRGEVWADLELTIHVSEHALFHWRTDQTLSCTVPVDLYTALSGAAIDVPSLDGHTIKISLADGEEQTLAGMGFPQRDGTPGPLHVRIHAITPTAHNAAQQALLQQLAASLKKTGYAACPELAAWQHKLKSRS